ncbi:hypothetical protein QF010_004845 [Pseudomonas silensiensis]
MFPSPQSAATSPCAAAFILLLDLAENLDDKPRHLAMAIYQLSELGLLLVERSL